MIILLWFCVVHILCKSDFFLLKHTLSGSMYFVFPLLKLCLFPLQNQEAVVAQSPCSRTGSKMKIEGVTYQWFWCGKFPKNKSNKKSNMVGSIIYLPQWPPEKVVEVFQRLLFGTIFRFSLYPKRLFFCTNRILHLRSLTALRIIQASESGCF